MFCPSSTSRACCAVCRSGYWIRAWGERDREIYIKSVGINPPLPPPLDSPGMNCFWWTWRSWGLFRNAGKSGAKCPRTPDRGATPRWPWAPCSARSCPGQLPGVRLDPKRPIRVTGIHWPAIGSGSPDSVWGDRRTRIKKNSLDQEIPTHRYRMILVRFQFTVVRELHVDGPAPHLGRICTETGDHGRSRILIGHFEERLVLALQHQHVGHATELHAQLDHFRFARLVRYVPNVNDAWFT